jgi:hypothetical protein
MTTVVETETGAWAVLDAAGRQLWASPFFQTACQRAACDLAEHERWTPALSPGQRRRNRAQRAAWAVVDARRT